MVRVAIVKRPNNDSIDVRRLRADLGVLETPEWVQTVAQRRRVEHARVVRKVAPNVPWPVGERAGKVLLNVGLGEGWWRLVVRQRGAPWEATQQRQIRIVCHARQRLEQDDVRVVSVVTIVALAI